MARASLIVKPVPALPSIFCGIDTARHICYSRTHGTGFRVSEQCCQIGPLRSRWCPPQGSGCPGQRLLILLVRRRRVTAFEPRQCNGAGWGFAGALPTTWFERRAHSRMPARRLAGHDFRTNPFETLARGTPITWVIRTAPPAEEVHGHLPQAIEHAPPTV
jgi:hypothetical protein